MNNNELLPRLNGIEWNDFECNRAQRGVLEEAYKSVSGFEGTAGGWLVFGVSALNGSLVVTCVQTPDSVQNDFLSVLRSGRKLSRAIAADAHCFQIDGKHVLAFQGPETSRSEKPVYLMGDPRQSYFRCGGRVPPSLATDKARKESELMLIKKPLVTKTMRSFRQNLDTNQKAEHADVLALALSLLVGQALTLTTIRSLGISTNQQTKAVSAHLMCQQLLDPLGDNQFQARENVRQRFAQGIDFQRAEEVGTESGLSRDQVGTKLELCAGQRNVLAQMAGNHDILTLMEWSGRRNRSKFREAVLAPLMELQLVAMTISDKSQSSKQRYQLTEKGRALQEEVA